MTQIEQFELILRENSFDKSLHFSELKKEWIFINVEIDEEMNTSCICGQEHIKEVCYIQNIHNKNIVTVGNTCIIKFFDNSFPSLIFKCLKDYNKNGICKFDKEYLNSEDTFFSNWEKKFLLDVRLKRNFTEKQKNLIKNLSDKFIVKYVKKEEYRAKFIAGKYKDMYVDEMEDLDYLEFVINNLDYADDMKDAINKRIEELYEELNKIDI